MTANRFDHHFQRVLVNEAERSVPPGVDIWPEVSARVMNRRPAGVASDPARRGRRLRLAVGAALLVGGLAGFGVAVAAPSHARWFHGGFLSNPGDSVKYYCVQGTHQSGGYSAYPAPVPGRRCFTNRADADRALGNDPRVVESIPPDVKAQGPAGFTYDDGHAPGHTCGLRVPRQPANVAESQRAFVHCANGWVAIAYRQRPQTR